MEDSCLDRKSLDLLNSFEVYWNSMLRLLMTQQSSLSHNEKALGLYTFSTLCITKLFAVKKTDVKF